MPQLNLNLLSSGRVALNWLGPNPCVILSLFEDDQQIWDSSVSQDLFCQDFLQHSLISLGALQIRQRAPQRQSCALRVTALTHYLEAAKLFRSSACAITDQNWPAIILFGISIVVFQLAIPDEPDWTCIMETLYALRSAAFIGHKVAPRFLRSDSAPLIRRRIEGLARDTVPELDAQALCAMDLLMSAFAQLQPPSTSLAAVEVCIEAGVGLRQWFIWTAGHPHTWLQLIYWPGAVGSGFIGLLASQHPCAVAMFIYWCAIITGAPQKWFLDGWGQRVASHALAYLGSEWDPYLCWPLTKLGIAREVPLCAR